MAERAQTETPALGSNHTVRVYEAIRDAILRGELEPGAPLSQVKLAERFGVSRGPVREATRMLERDGLLETEQNRRGRVAAFSVGDLDELYAMRVVVESYALRASVPRFSAEELLSMREILDGMDRMVEGGEVPDLATWEAGNSAFHKTLVMHGGGRALQTIAGLAVHAARYRRLYLSAHRSRVTAIAAEEHHEILAACERRDAAAAAAGLARHLSRTALTVMAILVPQHDPAGVRTAAQLVCGRSDDLLLTSGEASR